MPEESPERREFNKMLTNIYVKKNSSQNGGIQQA